MALAYMQGAKRILRKFYVIDQLEFQQKRNNLLGILRPLYGLADSGGKWHETILRYIKKDSRVTSTATELSLFYMRI